MSDYIIVGNKIYMKCAECGSLVQINKRFFGSLHFCTTEQEVTKKLNCNDRTFLRQLIDPIQTDLIQKDLDTVTEKIKTKINDRWTRG